LPPAAHPNGCPGSCSASAKKIIPAAVTIEGFLGNLSKPLLFTLSNSHLFFHKIMKSFTTFRTAQASTTANLGSQATTSTSRVRAALLGLAVMLGAAAWSPAQAQAARPVQAKQGDAESLWLTVENPALERMQVRVIQLSNNTCLSNEVNHKPSYGTKLSFGKLPAGEYAVLLRVGQERYRYAVQVQAKTQQNSTISVRDLDNQTVEKVVASAAR
jgi:hypothetical protein